MKSPYEIIVGPVITEKTTAQKEESNKVTFRVIRSATKAQIKIAVQKIFDVEVEKVQTINMKGKVKRMGRFVGSKPNWKKAIVTLSPGDSIEYFEGV